LISTPRVGRKGVLAAVKGEALEGARVGRERRVERAARGGEEERRHTRRRAHGARRVERHDGVVCAISRRNVAKPIRTE
jgi:hypothetical protein